MRKETITRKTNTISKLEDALISLLETKDLREIKTRELCVIAKVNHQTFYNYYYDHLDLYDNIVDKAMKEASDILHFGFLSNDIDNQKEYIEKIKETKYFTRLLKQKNNYIFKEKIKESIFPILEDKMHSMSREKERIYMTAYILNGSLSIIEEWIKQDYKDDSEYIASLMYKIARCIDLYH